MTFKFELLGFAISIYTDEASKSVNLPINEMILCFLPLNPTYIYFDFIFEPAFELES
jgi:hypothetical protein